MPIFSRYTNGFGLTHIEAYPDNYALVVFQRVNECLKLPHELCMVADRPPPFLWLMNFLQTCPLWRQIRLSLSILVRRRLLCHTINPTLSA